MRSILIFLNLYFLINFIQCIKDPSPKLKKRFPNFRRQVEELSDDFTTEKNDEDANINLVAFLVKNAKEIFGETEENTVSTASRTPESNFQEKKTFPGENTFTKVKIIENTFPEIKSSPIVRFFPTVTTTYELSTLSSRSNETIRRPDVTSLHNYPSQSSPTNTVPATSITRTTLAIVPTTTTSFHYNELYNKNVTLPSTTRPVKIPTRTESRIRTPIEFTVNVELIRKEVLNLTDNYNTVAKTEITRTEPRRKEAKSPSLNDIPVNEKKAMTSRRTCVACNNVQLQECNEPKNFLVPTVVCDHEEDWCYSQQTPFGLIDRGCFNVNLNITTYVCSCNLCNYISISEMPYTFTKRKEWIDNVIDLSRTRSFRTSIYKDMSCLSCEVNATTKSFDMLDNANCLEGNIGVLPSKQCADDEICGVKALRNNGYLWRGCLKSPLYNYWWSLCDSDLCNTDSVMSLYDDI